MTAILSEQPRISFTALARREDVHLTTCWRWALRGCKGHKLESFNVGGKKFTTLPAYERWLARINGETVASVTTPQREREIKQAESELTKAGW